MNWGPPHFEIKNSLTSFDGEIQDAESQAVACHTTPALTPKVLADEKLFETGSNWFELKNLHWSSTRIGWQMWVLGFEQLVFTCMCYYSYISMYHCIMSFCYFLCPTAILLS